MRADNRTEVFKWTKWYHDNTELHWTPKKITMIEDSIIISWWRSIIKKRGDSKNIYLENNWKNSMRRLYPRATPKSPSYSKNSTILLIHLMLIGSIRIRNGKEDLFSLKSINNTVLIYMRFQAKIFNKENLIPLLNGIIYVIILNPSLVKIYHHNFKEFIILPIWISGRGKKK
jgi:hypothetical protein